MTYDDDRPVPLNAGSRGMARDPALIYEEKESATCQGCAFEDVNRYTISEGVVWLRECTKGRAYGKRCKHYVERLPVRW